METIKLLELLLKQKRITIQQFKTYRGQVLHGDEEACRVGLKRKGLI